MLASKKDGKEKSKDVRAEVWGVWAKIHFA